MIRRPPRSTRKESSAASDVYKRQQWYQYQDKSYVAYLGKGFGGQRPIILPDFDMVIVVTGWNILPDKPFLHAEEAIERVVLSVIE